MVNSKKNAIVQVLLDSYSDLLRHLSRRLGGSVDASDVVQDTFLRIQKISADTEIRNLRAYVFRTAENVAIDHLRGQKSRSRYIADGDLPDTQDDRVSAEQAVDYRQRMATLERAVAGLPHRQRQVFLMHKFDGLSHSQIAHELGISRSAVEKLVMKALATCRDAVGDLLN